MFTGTRSRRRAVLLLALVSLISATGVSHAQSLKLSTLKLPPDVRAGSWVAYKVDVVSKNRPPRHLTQRLSVVALEGAGTEAGAWVELKTVEGGRTRTERGFFMRPGAERDLIDSMFVDDEPAEEATPASTSAPRVRPRKLKLVRYQRLTTDGKLYEYPVEENGPPLPDEDVSAMDMFEFPGVGTSDTLAPDTLRVGRKVIPCRVRRSRRVGDQDWAGEDTTYSNRAVMVRTYWRNPYIPVTGYARMVLEVSTERVPLRASTASDSAAMAAVARDTTGVVQPSNPEPQERRPASKDFFYQAEVTLTDLGNDAVPEITQSPEPAPQEAIPRTRGVIK